MTIAVVAQKLDAVRKSETAHPPSVHGGCDDQAVIPTMPTRRPRQDDRVGSTEDAFEEEAKRVLRRLLGGDVVDRDVEGAQNTRDFDLLVGDMVTHAVEVTSVQLGAARATRAGLERLRQQDLGLTASWDVYVHEEAQTRPIERNAPRLLNLMYENGVTQFDSLDPPAEPALAEAIEELASLRIPRGRASTTPPFRLSAGGFGSGSLDPSNITSALESEAGKPDNRRKLASAPAGATRHLFVWLHDSHWYVSSLLRDPISTPPAPLLPAEIDVVWAAVGEGREELTCSALLRADRAGIAEIDPRSGDALPRRQTPGAASGPPDEPPTCAECNGPGTWTVRTDLRTDPSTGLRSRALAWLATCEHDETHWAAPGRRLSAAELHSRGLASDDP